MKQIARPPAQYVVAPGTQYRLVANDYDKNKYAQCRYESQRSLIRCKQIRSKEDLSKRGGVCEEHTGFAKMLETNHKKEVMRCHAENDTKMQRRRFDPWITSNEYISDEDDYLQSINDVSASSQEWADNSILENHPLRHAKHFTEKDILKIKVELVQKDIDDLSEFKRLVAARAQKEHDSMDSDDDEEDLPTDMAQRRVFNAARRYARKDYLTLTQTIDPVYKRCCVGPNMSDRQVVDHVISDLLDKVEGNEQKNVLVVAEKQCENSAMQLSEFCFEHILLDRKQKMFAACVDCGTAAIRGEPTKCSFHIKECERANNKCSCPKCTPEKAREASRSNSRAEINVMDDDETLGNLADFEKMASPMQPFAPIAPPQQQQHRRYQLPPAQLLRPSTMGPPPGGSVPYQKPHPRMMTGAGSAATAEIEPEDEEKSLTCASDYRVRALEPTLYGEGKKKLQQQAHRPMAPPPRQGTPYHAQQKKTTMMSPQGGQKMTFQGWKNQASTGGGGGGGGPQRQYPGGGFGPTRYTMHSTRQQQPPPPPPRQIPLDRVQEHLSPDDSSAAVRYPPVDPQRRGVPYYKNPSFRRTDLPSAKLQPSTSTSSSQLLGPPPPQHGTSPKMYRPPQSRLPMAPHRAIAAGLNPADVGGGAHQRPQFRGGLPPPPPSQQQQRLQHPTMYPQNPSSRSFVHTTPLPSISLPPRRAPPQMVSYRVQNGPNGQRTTLYHPEIARDSGAPPGTEGAFEGSPEVPERSAGVNAAVTALDSARHDSRFANINVRTFLSMGQMGQKDLSKMSQEEIEQMAAEAEQEKASRKATSSGSSASSGNGGRTPRTSFVPSGVPAAHFGDAGAHGAYMEAPGAHFGAYGALPALLGPSPSPPKSRRPPVPDSVKEVVSSLMPSGAPVAAPQNPKKRKLEDCEPTKMMPMPVTAVSSEPQKMLESGEPAPKRAAPDEKKIVEPSMPTTSSSSAPRAAAPRTTAPAAGQSARAPQPVQHENPLDLLAELSAAVEAEESMSLTSPPPRPPSSGAKKTPKKTSTGTPRRLSSGKKKTEEPAEDKK